jgi:hypothetical protein
MNDQQHGAQDWAIPAVLVAIALGLLLVVGLAFALSTEQRAESPPLVGDLATYADSLIDHGADVPRVVVDRDGGFSVIVPGSAVWSGGSSADGSTVDPSGYSMTSGRFTRTPGQRRCRPTPTIRSTGCPVLGLPNRTGVCARWAEFADGANGSRRQATR